MKKKWLWAGIDLGVEKASVCIIKDNGEVVHSAVCQSSAGDVRRELCRFRRTRYATVGIEAGMAPQVARGLRNWGYPVQLFEVRQLSKFLRIRRNKTDADDALGIAEAGRVGGSLMSRVYLKSFDCQALQARLAIRKHLIAQRVAISNMLGRQLEVFGGRLTCKPLSKKRRSLVEAEIRNIFKRGSSEVVSELRILLDFCERLVSYQLAVDRELRLLAEGNDVCRRLMAIPGVGPLCALSFYAAIDDPHRFGRSTDVGSYFGLAPRQHESGLTVRKSRITKMGNPGVRALLVHAAGMYFRCAPPNSSLRAWTLRLEGRRGRLPSRVALARKLAVIMLTLWKRGTHFDPHYITYDVTPEAETGLHPIPVREPALSLA